MLTYIYKEPCEAKSTKLVNHTLRAPLPAFTMSNKLPCPLSSPVFLSFFLDLFGVTENGFDFAFLAAWNQYSSSTRIIKRLLYEHSTSFNAVTLQFLIKFKFLTKNALQAWLWKFQQLVFFLCQVWEPAMALPNHCLH